MYFEERFVKPERGNKYYTRIQSGGWNNAVLGKPLDKDCDVLANCVGYANGRFAEIMGKPFIDYQFTSNAENFIEMAEDMGLQITKEPTLGGIMVWQGGDGLYGDDGVGHVAIVEEIIDKDTIYTSESGYTSFIFANIVRQNYNGNWGMPNSFSYRGCIANPTVSRKTLYLKHNNDMYKYN